MGTLLRRFLEHGVRIETLDDGKLRVHGPLTDDLRDAIRAHRGAILAELAANDPGTPHAPVHLIATPEQRRELRELIARILPNDSDAEREWTLSVAVRDPEGALRSFRALAETLP
jgi:hypothetical protein